MPQTRVVHLRKEPYDTRIDRQTMFGNPFRIGPDGNRMEVINKYNQWLRGEAFICFKQERKTLILQNLHHLKGKTLGCWCKPKPCHGDVLVKLIGE
ncbi:unnamed protein product [marine sediment metagenome]|uniref:DUF4326 domain-containing protein n=1 Tax=marine sediment metagenome TaxID=412755 RepID=X1ADC5_9ZZZZ